MKINYYNNQYKKTLFLLNKYNFKIPDNIKDFVVSTNNNLIISCFEYENKLIESKHINLNNSESIISDNYKIYCEFQELSDSKYIRNRDKRYVKNNLANIFDSTYDFSLLYFIINFFDEGEYHWKKFISDSSKSCILFKYLPEVDDFFEIRLTTFQKIILTLYEDACSMKEIVYMLNNHPIISEKFSKDKVRKFVFENTKFFLYWGILNRIK